MTRRGAAEGAGEEAVYLQRQPDDAGRVGQHAVQNVQQGTQQRGRRLIAVSIVCVQAQRDSLGEQVTDVTDQS